MGGINTEQVGSKFGAAVAAVDITGDDYDEIFVGAPLYSGDQTEEGRVFVYTSTSNVRKQHIISAWYWRIRMQLQIQKKLSLPNNNNYKVKGEYFHMCFRDVYCFITVQLLGSVS